MKTLHTPVMLQEVLDLLRPGKGKSYIDATLGYAGHTLGLLGKGASVVGIDQDAAMLELAGTRVTEASYASSFSMVHDSFAHALAELSTKDGKYDGVLFDLGVSSYQLDTPERGFSFRYESPLDMRMNPGGQQVTARDLINGLGKKELVELFQELGEEHAAKKLAEAICQVRKLSPISTTKELVDIIETVIHRTGHLHPATKVFQSLRMAVNSEREELKAALPSALSCLSLGGVMAVISFHSLEDKIVKDFMDNCSEGEVMTAKPITPNVSEINSNPRSRSAKLRAIKRIKV